MKHRILVTGSAGRLGRAAVAALVANGHHVIGIDLRPTPGLPPGQSLVATLADVAVLRAAAKGVDCIIHLAATPDDARYPRGEAPDDGDNFLDGLVPNNIVGLYNLLEIARTSKVPRVVLASTGQVIDRHLDSGNVPVNASTRIAPRYLYACTKVFLEAVGQVYAREHGIEILAVRLGWCPRDAGQVAQIAASVEDQDVYLSPGDAGRFFAATVEAEKVPGFHVVYATSKPVNKVLYDLRETTHLIGFEPHDTWPTGASEG
ncbi:NAD-dependent epimerase/dehydratase family protein [Limnoglobus roseus]|uniref:NAD(P)-dependent oxidoreductase n=1 Tax=Limnoglobus roseus TaxID=2598579 RepID=A0A5C1A9Y2_9BACT|nr:NAD(P)-dependent oxidoreductase [Limnoglobus roseus]QEL16011.1 NAD(P)-dependent oxidoreductase [Limnoglobus roseus]